MDTVNIHTRKCIACGKRGTVRVPYAGYQEWKDGALIQDALPDLSADQREQLMTGTHARCWQVLFGEEDLEPMDLEFEDAP